jgi:hypothetical protein
VRAKTLGVLTDFNKSSGPDEAKLAKARKEVEEKARRKVPSDVKGDFDALQRLRLKEIKALPQCLAYPRTYQTVNLYRKDHRGQNTGLPGHRLVLGVEIPFPPGPRP